MDLIKLIRQESTASWFGFAFFAAVSGLANALVLAVINLAASDVAELDDERRTHQLTIFLIVVGIYVLAQRTVMISSTREVEEIIHKIRIRLIEKIRTADLIPLERIGRSFIYASINKDTLTLSQAAQSLVVGAQSAILVLFTLLYIAWLSRIAFAVCVAFIVAATWFYGKNLRGLNAELQEAAVTENRLFDLLTDLLEGFKEVRLNKARSDALYADLEQISLEDPGSGIDAPACFLVETIQGEGGLRAASCAWLRRLRAIADRCGALLVIDDIQAGCGRTGTFFSFESFNVRPDLICLSKSISGIGLPMALLLIEPEFDIWQVGEHNGTFRGNNLAFVSASAALQYWEDDRFRNEISGKIEILDARLQAMAERFPDLIEEIRGRGFMRGLVFRGPGTADVVSRDLFARNVMAETCGAGDQVLKLLPALTIPVDDLHTALDAIEEVIGEFPAHTAGTATASLASVTAGTA